MKKLSGILVALLLIIACFGGGASVEAASGFDIEKHMVEVDVKEDGTIAVTETMDVHFKSQLHGIYVNIPSTYEMDWELNGEIIHKSYSFPVRKVKVLSKHGSDITTYSDGVQIKIGDADRYANEHETYKFRYEIVSRDLDLDGLQMLFLNIISGKWDADIKRVEFSINMPKPFDRDKLLFDSPAGLTRESVGPFTLVVTGNTISGSYTDTLHPGEALTVQLMLGTDYFKFPDINDKAILGLIISGIIAMLSVICFYVFGKDDPVVETVEFHAPAGITSAEVGVIIDGVANDGDVISLILDWARRGLLTITDTETDLILTKKNDLEEKHRRFEAVMFKKLFKDGDEVNISKLSGKFYTTIQRTEAALDEYFRKDARRIFTTQSLSAQYLMVVLSCLPITIISAILIYHLNYDPVDIFLTAIFQVPTLIACTGILVYMESKKYMHKWYTKLALTAIAGVCFAIACLALIVVAAYVDAAIGYVVGAAYHLDIIASAFNNRELLNSWCHETACALVSLVNFFQTTDIDTCTGIGISQVCTVLHHYTGSDERSVILSYHRINSAMLAIYKLIAFGIHQVALNIIAATNSRIIQDRLAIFACLFVSKITTHIMITDFICYRLVCIAESWICFL